MNRVIIVGAAVLMLVLPVRHVRGQGTVRITFDGPPLYPSNTAVHVQGYVESDVHFIPILGTDGFIRNGGGLSGMPQNGTAYLQASLGDSLLFGVNDKLISVLSVDLAGYSDIVPSVTAYFVGYRPDGSTVRANFLGSGLTFQTFYFGPEFSGLTRVEVPDFGSLDNLVVAIPEPSAPALLLLGLALIAPRLRRSRRRCP